MFAGQGAQYYNMGRPLYEGNSVFRFWMDRLDAVAAPFVGQSVVEALYCDKPVSAPFDALLLTQPALFMTQYALAQTLLAELPPPDFLIGASLGEFVAAAVAGVADPEAMIFDLVKHARIFEQHCGGGAMLVVLDQRESFEGDPLFEGVELAGSNFDRCFAVAGRSSDIARVAEGLRARNVTHQLLQIAYAFHSSQIDAVAPLFLNSFTRASYGNAGIPVISCVHEPGVESVREFSAEHWWSVVRKPINFRDAFAQFRRAHPRATFVDLSPSGTMAGFAKYNLPEDERDSVLSIMSPFRRDVENLAAVRGRLSAAHDLEAAR